jgi:Predicted redox protein, regulator of disulfide bond formation
MQSEVLATFVDPQHMRIDVVSGSGHELAMDAVDPDGVDSAARPTEALLAALAGCTSMDVASILRKKRQLPTSYQIHVRGQKSVEHPQVFTQIVVEHRVSGAVEPDALRRSIELSATRYCPVSAMLSCAVTIEHRYRLRREGENESSALVVVTGPSASGIVPESSAGGAAG